MESFTSADLPLQIGYTTIFLLLIGVTGGIAYLTVTDWRDRRRRKQEEKGSRKR
ncbi:MAG: hypothetical protein ACFCU9_08820 [Cyanophyceae cyanobacterium]